MIAVDLSKQQTLNADPKAMQQLILLGILIEQQVQQCFSLLKKQEKLFYIFHKEL